MRQVSSGNGLGRRGTGARRGAWLRRLATGVAMLLASGMPALGQGQSPAPNQGERTYRFGIPPWQQGQKEDDIRRLYRPLLDWLGARVGCHFDILSSRSYEEMVQYMAQGTVDLASISPVPYVLAKKANPGIELLLTELSWNQDRSATQDGYIGLIVAARGRTGLDRLADLKGKRFGFVAEDSSSGYRYPVVLLRENGIDYARDLDYLFLGSHPRVTDAIVAGSIDAGATWDFNLSQAVAKHGDVFKIIAQTPPIPNLAIVAHPSLPPEIRAKVREELSQVDPKLLGGLPTAGYVIRPDSFYDVVRSVAGVR